MEIVNFLCEKEILSYLIPHYAFYLNERGCKSCICQVVKKTRQCTSMACGQSCPKSQTTLIDNLGN